MNPSDDYSPGLEGVIGGETAVSTITDGLSYRGYAVPELAKKATFDDVAYLLLHGDLPTAAQLADFRKRVTAAQHLPDALTNLFQALPRETPPMDVLRTAVSVLAHYDPECQDLTPAASLRKAERLLGQIPVVVAAHWRIAHGMQPIAAAPDLGHAASFLYLLRSAEAAARRRPALDVSLILYAEHEFNASTFTARVVCSTESDFHSCIVAAIGRSKVGCTAAPTRE